MGLIKNFPHDGIVTINRVILKDGHTLDELQERVALMCENVKTYQDTESHGISIENASYIENNLEIENKIDNLGTEKEFTPKLFSEEDSHKIEENDLQNNKLFDQSYSDDEEFEIPAFLRKQKF